MSLPFAALVGGIPAQCMRDAPQNAPAFRTASRKPVGIAQESETFS
jgi:hypothetical protein